MMEKMQNTMMKRYQMFAWLGLIIVLIAFLLSLNAASANATFFSVDKATREAAGTNSALALANVARHSIPTWVPSFKFLGLGIMLGAITMALGVIVKTLRDLGNNVMGTWPNTLNPGTPEKPRAAKMFPMIMMMGWLILIIGLIWALSLNNTVVAYWNHSVATELNTAESGSLLLRQLGTIQSTLPWLGALRFLGMAFLFTGITVALTVIIRTLQFQEKTLQRFVNARLARSGD
ncbi:MAG: hypothetical protein D6706_09950 [Chloroflexi bacterium]|nr:MAG: hypothetical protein D6706_09950 [Chloroflexota bacterium]